MAVNCSWADAQLSADQFLCSALPTELVALIQTASGNKYLNAIARACLQPSCTDKLFILYEPLITEISARWAHSLESTFAQDVNILSSLARILPFAPYLRIHLLDILADNRSLARLRKAKDMSIFLLSPEQLLPLLLALFRLFTYDIDSFSFAISPNKLYSLFSHGDVCVQYLAVQCFNLYFKSADAATKNITRHHIRGADLRGQWEDRSIDYFSLNFLEEKRWKQLEKDLHRTRFQRPDLAVAGGDALVSSSLSAQTANVGGILLPRTDGKSSPPTSFVHTMTADQNLRNLALALLESSPILLLGTAGSGKTLLVREAATQLNQLSSMITLHLNAETDAKTLLGLYTTSKSTGSFIWEPGILPKAMEQGRWIMVEDIDRAPAEVMSVMLPIIERGELMLPNRQERIRAHEKFRILATITTTPKTSNIGHASFSRTLLGARHWKEIQVKDLGTSEISSILENMYPLVQPRIDMVLSVHLRIKEVIQSSIASSSQRSRSYGLRALLRWCGRLQHQLRSSGIGKGFEAIPESTKEAIFADAIDCYVGHVADKATRNTLASCIAEEMQMPPQLLQYWLHNRTPKLSVSTNTLTVGRATLSKLASQKPSKSRDFASTRPALRMMESIATAVQLSEPVLLVGETGVGKTTLVQHLAGTVNQKLTVINLSQQSEASDLLGSFKPITARSVAMQLGEAFSDLFDKTFSTDNVENKNFQRAVVNGMISQKWRRLILLFREALKMARQKLENPRHSSRGPLLEPQIKRRKLEKSEHQQLRKEWTDFAARVEDFAGQVSHGDDKFVFRFVESRLIEALRNGEWVLLDEINLASPDTLENIVSLLTAKDEGRPSLLLPEAGSLERVIGHSNFRIFAAMNPATDAGKKDLVSAVRSRFTELFIQPPDNDIKVLVEVVETYLGPLLSADPRAASDVAQVYLEVKKLNEEQRLTDGAGERPTISMRSLVRCLMFARESTSSYELRRSLYEGFAMSFCTTLNKDSEAIVERLLQELLLKQTRTLLRKSTKRSERYTNFVEVMDHLVRKGSYHPEEQPEYIITAFVQRNLVNLARAASIGRFPILLQGPTSSGKTSMIEYLAKRSGNKFVRINNHEHTDLQEYLGSYASGEDGKLQYRDGVLVDALRKGHWIVLDELNLAPTDVLEALNRLLDDNRELLVPESQEIVRPHSNFMLFATQNPAGAYGGRKHLSRAFRNRFLELHFDDIPEDELETILVKRSQIAPSFCTKILSVYRRLSQLRQSTRLFEQRNSFATLRDLFRWALRRADDREQLAQNGFMLLAERVRQPAERLAVKNIIEDVMKVRISESSLYGMASVSRSIVSTRDVVWTNAMRRLFRLVRAALANNEPVLLIGETGCGKTQICQVIAEASGRRLRIYNANANTETSDLIGTQRPVRHRPEAEARLVANLHQILCKLPDAVAVTNLSIESLIERLERADISSVDTTLVQNVRYQIASRRSLFEWADGPLVNAMKAGDYFLLDEISLADDSVLERLNSILEPSRTMLLAEKGPRDSLVIAEPTFQFLATMNPGGDYGKRELSAALRNRLTEIWVPPLTEDEDILPIVQSKLVLTVPNAAQIMLDFARWFKAEFHTSSNSPLSLRDLLAWAAFLRTTSQLEPHSAMVHGASMIFIDCLGANPTGMIALDVKNLSNARERCLRKLGELMQYDVLTIYNQEISIRLEKDFLQIGVFQLSVNVKVTMPQEFVFEAPTTTKNVMRIVRALQLRRSILLEGSPGVGKTALVTALAKVAGKVVTRINLSDQTDLTDLFGDDVPMPGEYVGKFSWRDGPFLEAMQSGGWVLLDEMNLASQSVLEGLNSCLDHREEVYISELNLTFTRHPDFMLFATQNPHHQGGGRKGLPASFVNRFNVVYTEAFDRKDLSVICQRQYPDVSHPTLSTILSCIARIQDVIINKSFSAVGGPWEINLRDVARLLALLGSNPNEAALFQYFDLVIGQRFRTPVQRTAVKEIYHDVSSQDCSRKLFHNLTPSTLQVGMGFLSRDQLIRRVSTHQTIITPANLEYAEAIIVGINQRWPCILVGAAGCGKSSLLRGLAALSGVKLFEFALSAETDTMDLVGGFEQADVSRSYRILRRQIREEVQTFIIDASKQETHPNVLSTAMDLYTASRDTELDMSYTRELTIAMSEYDARFVHHVKEIDCLAQEQANAGPSFKWIDGPLVDALEQGAWFVLDNANLCDSSVLDRLNSLLEPEGHLVLSEQHNADGGSRIVRPHPNFRVFLTMDPRHGEVSRAMRNRSLEIYMIDEAKDATWSGALLYPCDSALYRFRHSIRDDWTVINPDVETQLAETCLGHLSLQDHATSKTWQQDILFGPSLGEYRRLLHGFQALPREMLEKTRLGYIDILEHSALTPNDAICLPIASTSNEPLLMLGDHTAAVEMAKDSAGLYEMFLALDRIQHCLLTAARRAQTLPSSELTVLERSASCVNRADQAKLFSQPVYNLLEALSASVRESLIVLIKIPHRLPPGLRILKEMLTFLKDFSIITSSRKVSADVIQVNLHTVEDLLANYCFPSSNSAQAISNAVGLFRKSSDLAFGRSLWRMWDTWRPATAKSLVQLDDLVSLEGIFEQFSSLTQRSDTIATSAWVQIQAKLLQAWDDVLCHGTRVGHFGKELATEIAGLVSLQDESRAFRRTYFAADFETLACLCDLHHNTQAKSSSHSEWWIDALPMLAGRNLSPADQSSTGSPVPDATCSIAKFAGWQNGTANVRPWRRGFALDLIAKIYDCRNQPLGTLHHLTEELTLIGRLISHLPETIAASIAAQLSRKAKILIHSVLDCHLDLLRSELMGTDSLASVMLGASRLVKTEVPADHYFREILSEFLEPAAASLSVEHNNEHNRLEKIGDAFILVSMAILHLIVPNQVSDPALGLTILCERYDRLFSQLQAKLEALRIFEVNFMGTESGLQIRMVQDEISDLGERPPPSQVVRPQESDTFQLQAEFSNLLRVIVLKAPEKILSLKNELGRPEKHSEARLLQQNIMRTVTRLSQIPRGYADLTVPVIRTLQCLNLGIDLLDLDNDQDQDANDTISYISMHTPLLGGAFSPVTDLSHVKGASPLIPKELHLRSVQQVICRSNISIPRRPHVRLMYELLQTVNSFYDEWKNRLGEDQRLAKSQSNYYAYRGEDREEDEALHVEMAEIFPDFGDGQDLFKQEPNPDIYNARQVAGKMAKVFFSIFSNDGQDSSLSNNVFEALETLGTMDSKERNSFAPVSPDVMLPGILLLLDRELAQLQGTSASMSLDVYREPQIAQARILHDQVQSIRKRFLEIHATWPDHALPSNVLGCTDEILQCKLYEPIMRLLPKVEKLHELLGEWQMVASREHSVIILYSELTALIISWRQLELRSWTSLLDAEQQKCETSANEWFFMVYEAIIVLPLRIVEAGGDFGFHVQELVTTLEGFLRETSVGEYVSRLRLINVVSSLASELATRNPRFNILTSAINNVLQHWQRFSSLVEKSSMDGRLKLETEIKEQIKLASWKDTNVVSLRDSSKRTHYKLFKIVKKYRTILAKPIEIFKNAPDPTLLTANLSSLEEVLEWKLVPDVEKAFALCGKYVSEWQTRPQRLKDPLGAAASMRRVYASLGEVESTSLLLQAMRENVSASIKDLQTQTPSKLTDETKDLVQHLKTGKRRLLANILKDLRYMGVKRNLGADTLEQQNTQATIFATTPCLKSHERPQLDIANNCYHDFIGDLPAVRKKLQDHSQEVTSSEITRCVGFAEGLLNIMRSQRGILAPKLSSVDQLGRAVIQVKTLHQADFGSIEMLPKGESAFADEILMQKLDWVPGMLDLSCKTLEIQAKLGELDLRTLIELMSSRGQQLRQLRQKLSEAPELPLGLSSRSTSEVKGAANQALLDLRVDLQKVIESTPKVAYLLNQIVPWTQYSIKDSDIRTNGVVHLSLQGLDKTIRETVDMIFVSLQRLNGSIMPQAVDNRLPAWLSQGDIAIVSAMEKLNMNEIASSVTSALTQIQNVEERDILVATSSFIIVTPIFEQFYYICRELIDQYVLLHKETSHLAGTLAKAFLNVATEGFCGPPDPSAKQDQSDKLESGTGLGDGEGAEDISKDVGEDEDLSELAQEQKGGQRQNDVEDTEHAVDMGEDDLEGVIDDQGQPTEKESDGSDLENDANQNEMDEEIGPVDALDPSTVDEKLWDDLQRDTQKQLENEKGDGEVSEEKIAAQQTSELKRDSNESLDNATKQEREEDQNGSENEEEEETGGRPDLDQLNPHLQGENILDLPEEMELDGGKYTDQESISEDGLDDMSDVEKNDIGGPASDVGESSAEDEIEEESEKMEEAPNSREDAHEQKADDDNASVSSDVGADDQISQQKERDAPGEIEIPEQDDAAIMTEQSVNNKNEATSQTDITTNDIAMESNSKPTDAHAAEAPLQDVEATNTAADGTAQGPSSTVSAKRGDGPDESQTGAFKKLGDILDRWHQRRDILKHSEDTERQTTSEDLDLGEADLEHLEDDKDQGDAQALGAATTEQARALDQSKAIEDLQTAVDEDHPMADAQQEDLAQQNATDDRSHFEDHERVNPNYKQDNIGGSYIADAVRNVNNVNQLEREGLTGEAQGLDDQSTNNESSPSTVMSMSAQKASRLWAHYSSSAHPLSLVLTEQLRLILAPTLATKLRGDFRTGKRLNIKRIIPYIASGYKRDKIWMRRSVPSKRNYQVMIAVDNSRSMLESGAGSLALETLALLCKSLSMLEVGEICVVGFGDDEHSRVTHPFGENFTNDAGPRIFQNFDFQQTATNVRGLIADSIALFQDARLKSARAKADLWQLELIISDSIFQDHDYIRRLVRQASEERIMIVFVIVDAAHHSAERLYDPIARTAASSSIMDLKEVSFEDGEVKWKRYLDGFPFPYYLIVSDVRDLPGVLATALKAWFAEVVDSSV